MATSFYNYGPTLTLNRALVVDGVLPDALGNADVPIGGIRTFASFAIDNLSNNITAAQGQLLPTGFNPDLFAVIGSLYGGNGTSTFALPNLAGRTSSGAGQGPGLSNVALGEKSGAAFSELVQANLPASSGGSSSAFAEDQPDLGTSYFIRTEGLFPGNALTTQTIGVVMEFAGDDSDLGNYLPCDGRLLAIADYQELFQVIGTTYGGDGETTFALPDLRGRTIIGAGTGALGTYNVGDVVGQEGVTIIQANMPVEMGGSGQPFDNREPGLVMNFMIALSGVYGAFEPGTPTMAEVLAFAGTNLSNFSQVVRAAGQLLPINQNQALFSLLGTTFGGDGRVTFALPNLTGRSITGEGPDDFGGSNYLGDQLGNLTNTITMGAIPALDIFGTGAGESLYGGNLDDILRGEAGDDTIRANDGNDRLLGNTGMDNLSGGGGDDFISGGNDADTLDGGIGIDTLAYTSSNGNVRVNLGTDFITGGDASGDTIAGFENYQGGGGNDNITGSAEVNSLDGGGGDDLLTGLGGGDRLIGGAGSDTISYAGSATGVTVDLSAGTASGGDAGGDTYSGIENVIGSSHADVLTGNSAGNDLRGGPGDDILNGRGGADVIWGGNGADQMDGSAGIDTLIYSTTNGAIAINLAASTISGGDAAGDIIANFENFTGGGGNDSITGSNAVNVLTGGAGNDRIDGLAGMDILTGGLGLDTFVLDKSTLSRDTITDFTVGEDLLEISAASFTGGLSAGPLAANQFLANATGVAETADQRFVLNAATGELTYDSNGSASGGDRIVALFTGAVPVLTHADFLIV